MKRKFLTLIIILNVILFAGKAWPDFGSFSGNSDYSSSRSSSSSSRSSSSSTSSRSSSTPRSTTTRRSSTYNVPRSSGTNINVIPMAGFTSGKNGINTGDPEFDADINECTGVVFVLFVALLFWYLIHRNSQKRREDHSQGVNLNLNEPVRVLRPMEEYLELDTEFDEERIKSLMSNLYVQMQEKWQAKDISSLRPYMTDKFFSQMDNQLEQFRKQERTDITDRIAVLSTDLRGWRQSAGMDYITVGLNARIITYVLDDRTGKLISGSMTNEKFMEYEIELCRKSGMTTQPEAEGIHSETCPHCGAPLKLNASAQCEYCGSVITAVNSDWAICGMRGISQRTA